MNKLIDKLTIFIITLALYIPSTNGMYMVVPILIAVISSAVLSYFEDDRITLGLFAIYLIICFFKPSFIFFIPLICYDILFFRIRWIWTLAFLPLITNSTQSLIISKLLIAAFIIVVYILKYRTVSLQNIKKDYYKLRDITRKYQYSLKERIKNFWKNRIMK